MAKTKEQEMIEQMLEMFDYDEDNEGQIIIYTNYKYNSRGKVVPVNN